MLQNQKALSELKMSEYSDLFTLINEEHIAHNRQWLNNQAGVTQYSLKKLEVRHVAIFDKASSFKLEEDFFSYLNNYKSELLHLYKNVILNTSQYPSINITGRVKNEESIINKLYKKSSEQNGAFPINKVLNDLLGFRIIDNNLGDNLEQIVDILNKIKESNSMRIIHKPRINGDYKGYHIYFMGKDAKYFPVELQLWDNDNMESNLSSHEVYKKDYTQWPEIYQKGE
ncbi:RelA/SpoT domain-containing protein [Peribacillus frigoritolerans]|uniref:RelA/SpoT domain-containing protein n=1 Tax=Peribacillus TaxID=2675229 RepID=UPI002282306E|nr:RelA/SpoT domain-containing protein [Peribacillus frigoritolerans]MCY9005657.1 RelA/SpoT domain-containing protein [Peribacillus frigoritolerans]